MNHLRTPRAQALYTAMTDAHQLMNKVVGDYQGALAIMSDAHGNTDGMLALRQAGRSYAQAVSQYTNSAMAWLAFVDTELENPK